jgi:hypothetical protein
MQMTKATLRKFMIMLLSAAALSGGLGADAAYALGGGGFGAGHMGGGFGGGHMGGFGGGHGGGFDGGHIDPGFGRSHLGIGGGFGGAPAGGLGATDLGGLGTEHVRASAENHLGALAGVRMHPGRTGLHFHHRRWFGDYARGPRCDYGTDYVMADPDCRLPY